MKNWTVLAVVMAVAAGLSLPAAGQSVLGDIMSGSLVNPEPGVFALYDVTDKATGRQFILRQAVVGEERVKGKTGYWVETEIIPGVGYPMILKMLLTGPASDPANIHRVLLRDGAEPAEEVKPEEARFGGEGAFSSGERTVAGEEELTTAQGPVKTEHVVFERNGERTEVWTSDQARPMGIVRLVSKDGELMLRTTGKGGEIAQSVIDREYPAAPGGDDAKVKVDVREKGEPAAAPAPAKPAEEGAAAPVQKNFGRKGGASRSE